MIQNSTKCNSILYTIQPGDGTRYTFMISVEKRGHEDSRTFETNPEGGSAVARNSKHWYEVIHKSATRQPLLQRDHFSGHHHSDLVYMVSIFSPSEAAFTVSYSMLQRLFKEPYELVDYLQGHMYHPADAYTLYVVLAFLKKIQNYATLPSVQEMQKALTAAKDIQYRPELFKDK